MGIPALADGKRATEAAIDGPAGVALDRSGNLYITSPAENRVFKVGSDGVLHLIAGNGLAGYSGDGGPATAARLYEPWGIGVDSKGNVYVADQINRRVRKITPGGVIGTVAGNGTEGYSGDGGPATAAQMSIPHGVAIDSQDNIYISENGRIRKITSDGLITTVATRFSDESIAVDKEGNIFGVGINRVYKRTPRGVVSTVAGNGEGGATRGGFATAGPLGGPISVAVDGAGSLYIGTGYDRVWKVSNGRMSAFAGGSKDDRLKYPAGIAVDGIGNVYIADSGNHRVRKVSTTTGLIDTVAGSGGRQLIYRRHPE